MVINRHSPSKTIMYCTLALFCIMSSRTAASEAPQPPNNAKKKSNTMLQNIRAWGRRTFQPLGRDTFSHEFLTRFYKDHYDAADQTSPLHEFLNQYSTTQLDNAVIDPSTTDPQFETLMHNPPRDHVMPKLLLLHWLAARGNTADHRQTLEYLLTTKHGNVNAIYKGKTALHHACQTRYMHPKENRFIFDESKIIATLITGKANVNARDNNGNIPLALHLKWYSPDSGTCQVPSAKSIFLLVGTGAIVNTSPELPACVTHPSCKSERFDLLAELLHISGMRHQSEAALQCRDRVQANVAITLSARLASLTEEQRKTYTALTCHRAQALSVSHTLPNHKRPRKQAIEWWETLARWQLITGKTNLTQLPSGNALREEIVTCFTRNNTCPMPVVNLVVDYALPEVDYALNGTLKSAQGNSQTPSHDTVDSEQNWRPHEHKEKKSADKENDE